MSTTRLNTMITLLRREYWENKGGFLTTPIVVGGIAIGLTLLFLLPAVVAAQADVLTFVGNSYTSRNDMTATLASLVEAAGGEPVEVVTFVRGGARLSSHLESTRDVSRISSVAEIEPLRRSSNAAWAEPRVYAVSASSTVSAS